MCFVCVFTGVRVLASVSGVMGLRDMSQCGDVCKLRALRPLIDIISLAGTAGVIGRARVGCKICTLFLGRAGDYSLGCKHESCSCRRKAVIYFTPNRAMHMSVVRSRVAPRICNVIFRPSLVHNASLTGDVGDCAFFSCTIGRTLRLSSRRGRVIVSYLGGVDVRLRRTVSGRDGTLVTVGVRLLLGCYVQFCRQRFVAHDGTGGSTLAGFRRLLGRCFLDGLPVRRNLPSIGCFTSGVYLSSGCFKSVMGGRAKGAPRRRVRSGIVRVTGRRVIRAGRAIDRVTCALNFRCPRRLYQLFGGHMKYAPGRCEARRKRVVWCASCCK